MTETKHLWLLFLCRRHTTGVLLHKWIGRSHSVPVLTKISVMSIFLESMTKFARSLFLAEGEKKITQCMVALTPHTSYLSEKEFQLLPRAPPLRWSYRASKPLPEDEEQAATSSGPSFCCYSTLAWPLYVLKGKTVAWSRTLHAAVSTANRQVMGLVARHWHPLRALVILKALSWQRNFFFPSYQCS